MFGGYTVRQAAIAIDTCDEIVLQTIARGGYPTYRLFLLFGPIRLKKDFIDAIAPGMRAFHKKTNSTRADWERRKQEARRQIEEIEQMKRNIEKIQEEIAKGQEDFFKQFNELMEEKRRRMLSQLRADQEEDALTHPTR